MSRINMLFPEIVYTEKLNIDNNKLLESYNLQEFYNNQNNNFTKISINNKVLDDLIEIKKVFLQVMKKFSNEVLNYNNDYKMTTSWFTKTEKNQISLNHHHANSMFSGVYYFKNNSKCEIQFEKKYNSMFELTPNKFNSFNSQAESMEFTDGDFIIFYSHLNHKIVSNNTERKSLAMNFIPIGTIGNGVNEVTL